MVDASSSREGVHGSDGRVDGKSERRVTPAHLSRLHSGAHGRTLAYKSSRRLLDAGVQETDEGERNDMGSDARGHSLAPESRMLGRT